MYYLVPSRKAGQSRSAAPAPRGGPALVTRDVPLFTALFQSLENFSITM
jgi:hypothetical protein